MSRSSTISVKSAATPVRKRPSLDFSVTGLVYCTMMMFMGVAAINSQANLLFGVFGLMIGILLISYFISRLVLKRLRVERILPDFGVVGTPMSTTYVFSNGKRVWASLSVSLSELDGVEAFVRQPAAYLLHAAPDTRVTITVELMPKRRGLHHLGRYQIGTSFPFGFIKRAVVRHQEDRLLVYPALAQVDPKVLRLFRSAESTGAVMKPRPGGQDEFFGVKEYRQGENPRLIYWRRSARTGTLVLKDMTRVSPPRLLVMVDTRLRDSSVEAYVDVERAIATAASLANHALEAGLLVGLIAYQGEQGGEGVQSPSSSSSWRATVARWTSSNVKTNGQPAHARDVEIVSLPPNRGKRQRREILTALARIGRNEQHDARRLIEAAERVLKTGTTPVLVTPGDQPVSLSDRMRGLVVLPAGARRTMDLFRFDPGVDFTRSMPVEQQPRLDSHDVKPTTDDPTPPARGGPTPPANGGSSARPGTGGGSPERRPQQSGKTPGGRQEAGHV